MREWLDRARIACANAEPEIGKAAEWLVDNDYLVERAVALIRGDLPTPFYARLAALEAGPEAGLPRVLALARGLFRCSHLQLSLSSTVRFVNAYQEPGALTIAELWAFPTMLRLVCLELIATSFERLVPALAAPFAPASPEPVSESLDETECVARSLALLRVIDSIPWKEFFARTSRVQAILEEDPAGFYARMDFETCDHYRKQIEELAYGSPHAEPEVAARVVEQARRADSDARSRHVGFWLVGEGREELERLLGRRLSWRTTWRRGLLRHAAPLYAAALVASTGAAIAVPILYLVWHAAEPAVLALGVALAMIPASLLGFTLVHWIATLLVSPRVLPKLDFAKGIPPECATAVVMPVMVGDPEEARRFLDQLACHFVGNADPALRFALLSDPADAPAEQMPGDEAVVHALVDGIRELNIRYGASAGGPFHLLHRSRRHNPVQECWMAWERKRGKLDEFNRLIAGEAETGFSVHEGDPDALRGVRFVVTVDADTIVPPGSVARLVGTLAHPLNQPEFDAHTGRVRSGYTIVQPRIEISPESGNASLFSRLYSGDTAIDIYTRAVSDIYQDLFGSGIYVGKGIYDVAGFRRSLEGRMPENALASHDLIEGIHGRVALASDIVLYEDFPIRYLGYARRWHRWLRGDWQLVPWLARRVPGPAGSRLPTRLSALDRWKIIDNLRRSLVPPALLALLAAGWLVLPGSPWVWTALGVAAHGTALFTEFVTDLGHGRRRGAMRGTVRSLADHAGRWALAIVFLARDAALAIDAISRTLWRVFVTHRDLIEWRPAAHTTALLARRSSRAGIWWEMWSAPALSIALATAAVLARPAALPSAAPLLLLWFASPEVALWTGRPRRLQRVVLDADDRAFLRRVARRTWLFFETFVGPDDHWLPPDNYQEEPRGDLAHRTSPTNVGMMLLSSLTACDLGHLGLPELAARIRNSLDTLERLERHRGHLLNWYDTRSLDPLEPRYVSTVDSGNLAVSLVALREGCLELAAGPVLRQALWNGLADTLELLMRALDSLHGGPPVALRAHIASILERVTRAREEPGTWRAALQLLCERDCPALEAMLVQAIELPAGSHPAALHEIRTWLERAHHHMRAMQRDLEALHPWLSVLDAPPPGCEELARELEDWVPPTLPLAATEDRCAAARELVASAAESRGDAAATTWLTALEVALQKAIESRRALRETLLDIAARSDAVASGMDFRLLYDTDSRHFFIGYNVSADRLDPHHYDLLATEARLASFFAIAKGDVPHEHWFFLGRPITQIAGGLALVSWGGSMFEYLMPALLLRSSPGTLLAQSEWTAVAAQRRYAARLGSPWGISESGFSSLNPENHYRYRAFGVPGLGLRRGLARDLVVAPYATALTLPLRPDVALENLREFQDLGLLGAYGFYEAADFTPERVPEGQRFAPVRSYMAHHQGMILAAAGNALCGDALVRRFHADRRVRAAELLLQERIPRELPTEIVRADEQGGPTPRRVAVPIPGPWIPVGADAVPQVHALGNGRLSSWISEAGAGALFWHDCALTRWLPDATRDDHGLWIYVRDEDSGAIWSVGRQPTAVVPDESHVVFHAHLAEFHRRDHGIAIGLEAGVAPGDDLEIRHLTIVNESEHPRSLVLTSYAEVALAEPLEDERHPAFSKLFVHSEWVPGLRGLLFARRPRGARERSPLLLHRLVFDDADLEITGFDADRRSFLGRSGDLRRPRGACEILDGSTGFTLDPVMALQVRVVLEPRERRRLAFLTVASASRESLYELAERHATLSSLEWALRDAATESAKELQKIGLEPMRLPELQLLASLLLYPCGALRAPPAALAENPLGQPRLWGLGLSGDLPIVLLRASDPNESTLLRVLVRAHQLWRRRGIHADLVILRTGVSGYAEPLRELVFAVLQESGAHELLGRKGGIHLHFADQIGEDERRLLEAAARVILDDAKGPLARQLADVAKPPAELPGFAASRSPDPGDSTPAVMRRPDLAFDNGFGGFSEDGREYVIHLEPGQSTPAPWCNVLANEEFGSVVSESGAGFTWAGNSGENRLTPWTNDPVADPPGEVLYLRDEETAAIWTPTPKPAGTDAPCQIRHGAGYTEWRRTSHGFEQQLLIFVPPGDPVKLVRLRLQNLDCRPRRVTATFYAEWVLGALRSVSRPFVICEYEPACHALLARNPWNPEFAERVAFLGASLPPHGLTADRREFLGREGDLRTPASLGRWGLSGRVRPGDDPCAAYQVHLDVGPEETGEVVFALGQGRDRTHATELVQLWQDPAQVERGWTDTIRHWDRWLGAVRVRTPDPAFDLSTNRWLQYQTLASRLLARAGFYQAGGAIGFRDQLQDVLAFLHADPARTRAHLLVCAAHQFEEGDVLHWWHPPSDRGVRTRCSDDLLWLPYTTCHYVEATGDESILDEAVPFLRAAPLAPDEQDRYAHFDVGDDRRSLFEHCERALERGVTCGAHGLPLIGSGDWNDGMDRVGRRGRGESVWLGWFAIATIDRFVELCARRGEKELADRWRARARELEQAIETSGWDGAWYRRAFDDDGRPWGSAACDECRIDSIAQSWSALSGAAAPERARKALESAERELVREDDRVIRLLWPPFAATPRDPGYIKAYPPGIRENGGQYTHAAAWLGWAFAAIGDGERAWRVRRLLDPIRHASVRADAERYAVEPYVLAADIGSVSPHIGRGGWTWYTGSAAWTWRLGVEALLGLRLRRGRLIIDPCLPPDWDGYQADVRGPAGTLAIRVEDPERVGRGVAAIAMDGVPFEGDAIDFPTDGSVRRVDVRLGGARPAPE